MRWRRHYSTSSWLFTLNMVPWRTHETLLVPWTPLREYQACLATPNCSLVTCCTCQLEGKLPEALQRTRGFKLNSAAPHRIVAPLRAVYCKNQISSWVSEVGICQRQLPPVRSQIRSSPYLQAYGIKSLWRRLIDAMSAHLGGAK